MNARITWILIAAFTLILTIASATHAVTYTESSGLALATNDGSNTAKLGFRINFTGLTTPTATVTQMCKIAGDAATRMQIWDAINNTVLQTSTISGNCAAFNVTVYNASKQYYITTDNNGAARQSYRTATAYPITSTPGGVIKFLSGANGPTNPGTDNNTGLGWNVNNITFTEDIIPSPSPTITFQGQTPSNASNNYWQDTWYINTTSNSFGGSVNTTHYIYNSSFGLVSQRNGTASVTYVTNYTSLTPGIYYYNASAFNGTTSNYTETRQLNITWWNAYLNITLKNAQNGSVLANATINVTDTNTSWKAQYNTTNGNLLALIAKNNTQNVTVDASGYVITSELYNSNSNLTQYLNVSLYTNNSVSITIRDEDTGSLITENITVVITGTTETTYYTATGSLYVDSLTDGSYTIKFSGTNYTLNQYSLTVGTRSHQSLTAYLTATTSTTTFTILDYDSSQEITSATVTQNRLINGSWTVVNTKSSDITGRAQFTYTANVKYQFIVQKTDYATETFYLDPVLFSSYNVRLRKTNILVQANTPDLLGVSVSYYNSRTNSTTWQNGANNTIVWTISSPSGSLQAYNMTVGYPGGSNYQSGTNAIGEQFTSTFQINNANSSSRVSVAYCYKSTTSASKCFNYTHLIQNVTASPGTWAANNQNTYGMGLLERVLFATVFILGISGTIFMLGGVVAGLIVALLIMGFFAATGFAPLWAFLPSMLVGFFIIKNGGQN